MEFKFNLVNDVLRGIFVDVFILNDRWIKWLDFFLKYFFEWINLFKYSKELFGDDFGV